MDIFSLFTLLGGLAFFLYGMKTMSAGLARMTGGSLEKQLGRLTSNKYKAFALGSFITVAVQSSSAVTVMLVGLVNSGVLAFSQSIGIIMGSNVGTTFTAWILSLSGISGDSWYLRILQPESFSPVIALIGILMISSKGQKKRDIGTSLVGFAILMYGMILMKSPVSTLANDPGVAQTLDTVLTVMKNPFVGVLAGAVITGLIQSSAAAVGMLQTLALTGRVNYAVALPFIMGQNIGTCFTALISSIGVSKNAKRVSVVHVCFNLFGTVICLTLFYILNAIFDFAFVQYQINAVGIALVHTLFNVVTSLMLMPFSKQLEKLACAVIRDDKDKLYEKPFIDERLLLSPSFAVVECMKKSNSMFEIAKKSVAVSLDLMQNYTGEACDQIDRYEEQIDSFEDKLGTFLVQLSSKSLSEKDNNQISKMLHCIGDFERLGDHACNLKETAIEMHEKNISFSDDAKSELQKVIYAVSDILALTYEAYRKDDENIAADVEPLEQVIDDLISTIKYRHIERLKAGDCTIEYGFVLGDILTNLERISDHCSNIAVSILRIDRSVFDTHTYLNEIKTSGETDFEVKYNEYAEQYKI